MAHKSERSALLKSSDHMMATFPGNTLSPAPSTVEAENCNVQLLRGDGAVNFSPDECQRSSHFIETVSLDSSNPQELLATLERTLFLLKNQVNGQHGSDHTDADHKRRLKPLLPPWLTRHLLLITFLMQVLNVGVLEIFHAIKGLNNFNLSNYSVQDEAIVYTSNGIMILVEAAHLLVIILVSFKLAKQVLHHTASGLFLAQCYLSTVLLFAGVYTLYFRFETDAWTNVTVNDSTHPFFIFLRMLYFSVSTATLCGTSTVEPVKWYAYLTVALQMLFSFVYFASILSISIVPKKQSKTESGSSSKFKSITGIIRRCFHWCCCSCCSRYYYF